LQIFGKRGEKQFGIDILDLSGSPSIHAAQCKLKEPQKSLSPDEIQQEVDKVKAYIPRIGKYTILTTAKVSTLSQTKVLEINQEHRAAGLFEVEVLNWDHLCRSLMKYPDLQTQFYGASIPSINLPASPKSLTIIIPVYNEARRVKNQESRIEILIRALRAEGLIGRYQIILCDDGSTDGSYDVMKQCCEGLDQVVCVRNPFNSRKVGAIQVMAEAVRTPFTLTLDADSILYERPRGALEGLMRKMTAEGYAAACFRIVPDDRNWLGKLQKIDYSIFTDSVRRLLGVPVCLIGQGVLWRTDRLLSILASHSGNYDGDDLENTIIALTEKMPILWERTSVVIATAPKKGIRGLIRQRALSWDFGMFRVLFLKRALRIGGESGAFYKNLLLMDFFAHPFRLLAVPVLLPALFFKLMGPDLQGQIAYEVYARSVAASFKYFDLDCDRH
jgi:glycosyltransferase involved in cell wall biosynthesis